MKIRITVDAGEAMRAGRNEGGECVVDVDPADLTEAEREALAEVGKSEQGAAALAVGRTFDGSIITAPSADLAGVKALAGKLIAARASVALPNSMPSSYRTPAAWRVSMSCLDVSWNLTRAAKAASGLRSTCHRITARVTSAQHSVANSRSSVSHKREYFLRRSSPSPA